ncbi:hypothetical protein [Halobacterium yunchengense]|uniref:hypothetical protein n=1 Tax=Halobacterium yunchengense TaxID=3108497 RepID=UPI003009667D
MTPSRTAVARGLTVVAVAALLGVLGRYLGRPGYTPARLTLFAALGASAVAGAGGVVAGRSFVAAGAACALLLLGFWQAVLWVYVLPVAALFLVAAVALAVGGDASEPLVG